MNTTLPLGSMRNPVAADPRSTSTLDHASSGSAVSWGAIVGGAAGAAALSLILLILGTGLGLSSVSPWSGQGIGAVTLGVSTILWLTFTQVAASGLGGYLAGRLRSRWTAVHADEVYFRDTAHGFLAWAVSTLVTAAMLSSAVGAILGTTAQAGATVAGGAATTAAAGVGAAGAAAVKDGSASPDMGTGYFVDVLFRKDPTAASAAGSADPASGSSPNAEVARIVANALRAGSLSAEDTKYVGQLVAQRTGLSQADAEKRVTDSVTKLQTQLKDAQTAARDAADKARKASAGVALWLFISLLAGAFLASLAATFGGRRRDMRLL